jgi:NifU-like protein involved in Fe-S cluster formation
MGPYSHVLLRWASALDVAETLTEPHGRGEAVSKVCGSEVSCAVRVDDQGRVSDLAMQVEACAVGQAATAIVAHSALGAGREETAAALHSFQGFLKEGADMPAGRFERLGDLEPVRAFPRRHASAQLALKALLRALEDAA